jgi:sugar transferase (PEP-CTERM system associated)
MFKFLHVYYPTRAALLLLCEALIVGGSFTMAVAFLSGQNAYAVLVYENGIVKIAGIALFTLLLSYYLDLYDQQRISGRWETYFRLLLVLSVLSFSLAGLVYFFPRVEVGHNVFVIGVCILALVLTVWRRAYESIVRLSWFRERVYVVGNGQQARMIVQALRARKDSGMEVVNELGKEGLDEPLIASAHCDAQAQGARLDRVIVALEDRRGTMPVPELLALRLRGVVVEDACSLMERLTGRMPLDGLNPSSLIFSDGFNVRRSLEIQRRVISIVIALFGLIVTAPIIPFIILAVRLSSPGPILFRQTRIGRSGRPFVLRKFRTMWLDAEANGAVWATKDDPRVTPLGRLMRRTRLDEIPQLWNVLRGDMAFVGPRPERPEFVNWLSDEIPYYDLRHMIRPGITGWAQVRYKYGSSLEETRRKLEYDLYYVKHLSLGLDSLIMFETIKTILMRRGAQ